jgi:GT2 family glycosyltransferase
LGGSALVEAATGVGRFRVSVLTISLVTFNSERVIRGTLEALMKHLPVQMPASVTVVDNRSTDSTREILRDCALRHERLSVIENDRNVGFGQAHNRVIRDAQSTYHAICNPDILVESDVFTPLASFLHERPDVGMVCPKFVFPDGRLQPNNHLHPSLLDLFLRRFLPESLHRLFAVRLARYEMRDVGYDNVHDVPFVSGAFMFCRTNVLQQIGAFDDRYFLYFEDADLSRKFQARGLRTVFNPRVTVIHAWERAAHKDWFMAWTLLINAIRYFNKWGYKIF